mgnify:FL=1|tara:strand:+ start:2327 stop:2881 length:555 start_codon:yes stop_codon:yes gene_type:complete
MKQTYLLIMLLIFVTSCGDKQKNLTTEKSPVVEIGSALLDGTNSMTPLFIGESSNQQIWLEYIKAHNDKNLEKIAKINAEDWEGYTADGSVVKGNKAHIEVLDNWFKSANPKWEVKWMIANAVKNNEGIVEQWLTTGNDYTDVDENGNEIFEHNVHDVMFSEGKIKRINVYKRAKAEESAEFSY